MAQTATEGKALFIAIAVSVILAIPAGLIFGASMEHIAFLGEIFLNALRMIIVPLVMASIISGISALGDIRKLGRIGGTTVAYYATTTALAVITGLILVNLIEPGVGVDVASATVPERAVGRSFSPIDVITGLVTPNLFAAMANTQVLPLIVFSLIFGGILTTMGEKGKRVLEVVDGLNEAFMKLVQLIMYTAPVGLFALIAPRLGAAVATGQFKAEMIRLALYSLTVVLGLAIHGFITIPLLYKLIAKANPLTYLRRLGPVLLTAFSTASSSATLPLTIKTVETKGEVSNEAASFVLPLGATINMDGTALYEAVAAVYIAQAFGVPLDFEAQIIVAITATLASIGAAGIPEAGLITMILVLNAVGLPLEGLGAILAVDWLLDRFRTTINVWGDACGAAMIDRVALGHDTPPAESNASA